MRFRLLVALIIICGMLHNAMADVDGPSSSVCMMAYSCPQDATCELVDGELSGCEIPTSHPTWFLTRDSKQGFGFTDCVKCAEGYELETSDIFIPCEAGFFTTHSYCKLSGSDCVSDTEWSAGNSGYQKKVTRTSINGMCRETTEYRCADGFYGSSTNGTTGCTKCDAPGTSKAGSASQSDCYISSGTGFSDEKGSGQYTSDCSWQ